MSRNAAWKIGLAVVGVLALLGGLWFATADDDTAPTAATPTATVEPSEGPSGRTVAVSLTSGTPESKGYVILVDGTRTAVADVDENGSFSQPVMVSGPQGPIRIEVLENDVLVAETSYTILPGELETTTTTSTTTPTSTVPDPVPPAPMTLTLTPDSGAPDVSNDVIIVVTGPPGEPVTVNVPQGASGNVLDANGVYSIPAKFKGAAGASRTVTGTVGGKKFALTTESKEFNFVGARDSDTEVNVGPDRGPGPALVTIAVKGEPFELVSLIIEGQPVANVPDTDTNGVSTFMTTFNGDPRTIRIQAAAGNGKLAVTKFELTSAFAPIGTYILVAAVEVESDDGGHKGPIGMPSEIDLDVEVASITVNGTAPFVGVSGDLADDGKFDVTGSGTVAGIADVSVRFVGTITGSSLVGQYSMGVGGELPGGEAITYVIESTEFVSTNPAANPMAEFYAQLSDAQANGDVDFLYFSLHPAVPNRYSEEACRDYLSSTINPEASITFVQETARGSFDYETDGLTETIDDAITLDVLVTTADGETVVETHAVENPDGTFAWFTDCGDV
jgi:hypothetical protein